jgi:hypothetical protein
MGPATYWFNVSILCYILGAAVSIVASLLTLVLIRMLDKWNGYMILIFQMTLAQLLYDIGEQLAVGDSVSQAVLARSVDNSVDNSVSPHSLMQTFVQS